MSASEPIEQTKGQRGGVFTIPNVLTMARIALIPVFIICITYNRYRDALIVFVIAALTDVFDGLFARLKNQRTSLGKVLDPLADKFLLVTSFIVFAVYGWVPRWLAIIVISRDIIIVTGWCVIYFVTGAVRIEPSSLGKITIWMESLLIAFVLVRINYSGIPDLRDPFFVLTAGASILSGLHYMYKGFQITHAT